MSGVWQTKYGPRRVRHDPPTLAEAIEAAAGLTDDLESQTAFAASLMDLPEDEVRAAVMAARAPRKPLGLKTRDSVVYSGRDGASRAVLVERKPSRRLPLDRPAGQRSFG